VKVYKVTYFTALKHCWETLCSGSVSILLYIIVND
jgi:hypothetical protein